MRIRAAWAGPLQSVLRQTVPTRTPTPDPNATPTAHPSATPSATLAPGEQQIVLRQGLGGYSQASDSYLDFWEAERVYGSEVWLRASSDGTASALFRFDLSDVPTDVVIVRAHLQFYADSWTEPGECIAGWPASPACCVGGRLASP